MLRRLLLCSSSVILLGRAFGTEKPTPSAEVQKKSVHRRYSLFGADYWKGYAADTGYILTAPSRFQKSDWATTGILLGSAASFYFADREIRDKAQKNRDATTDDLADVGKKIGDGAYLAGFCGVSYAAGWAVDDPRARRTALLGLESLVLSGVFTAGVKRLAHRHRPDTEDDHDAWDGPGFSTDSDELSFPSGHSAAAFSVATVVASEYADTPLVSPAAYAAAALAALSRVNDDEHWASDIFVGSAIGYFTAKAVVGRHDPAQAGKTLSLVPLFDGERAGLALICRF